MFETALHPIRRHYTPSVRVQRPTTGAALRNGCSAPQRVQRYVTGAAPHNRYSEPQQAHGHTALQRDSAQSSANRHTALQREQWPTTERNTPPQQPQHKQQCTRSVGITPLLFGCSAPQRVQRPTTGAAPHNGCSATQRMQRHATDAFRATCAPRDGEYATMTTPKHSMSGAGAIASDLSISPGILSTGTRPTGDRGIVTAAAQHPVHRHATNRCYLERLLPHSKLVSQCHNHPSVTRPSGTTRLHPAVAASST